MAILDQTSMLVEMPVLFRLATRSDLPKLEWFGQYTHYRNLFRRAFREQQSGRRVMLVAATGSFPIGLVIVQLKSGDAAVADGKTRAYLYSLRVMEMFRGHGIGTRLVQEAENIVLDRHFHWTTIAVVKENHRARRLYERLGYRVFRDDPGQWSYLDHRGQVRHVNEPCWLLEKHLHIR